MNTVCIILRSILIIRGRRSLAMAFDNTRQPSIIIGGVMDDDGNNGEDDGDIRLQYGRRRFIIAIAIAS